MNERERILDLVKKGVISTDEALNLLEAAAKEQGTKETNQTQAVHETTSTSDDHAEQTKIEKELADLAEQASRFSAKLDNTNEQIQKYHEQERALEEQITVLDTMEDLDSLTPEKAMERQNAKDQLAKLKSQVMMLEDTKESLNNQLNAVRKDQHDVKKEQGAAKFQIPDDWKESANETFNTVGQKVGGAERQFGGFMKDTVSSIMENVDWKDVNIKVPGIATTKFDHEFIFDDTTASIIDVKNANGNVAFKSWDATDIKVVAKIKLYGKMDEPTPLEAFSARSNISLDEDQFTFQVPNKRVQADLTFYLPNRSYDHTSVRLLNGSFDLKDFQGKDLFLKSTNGTFTIDNLNATMLEVEGVNGDVKVTGGSLIDTLVETVNGQIVIKNNVESIKASTVNGDVKITLAEDTLRQLTANSVNGSVKTALPSTLALKGDVKTRFGAIKSRLSDVEVLEDRQSTGNHVYRFERNAGVTAAELNLSTAAGSVLLKDSDK